jgi:flagellar protein FlaG
MASTAASELIFFIASMIVAATVAGALMGTVFNVTNSLNGKGNSIKAELDTQISIINDVAAMPYNATAQTLVLYVKNTGASLLDCNYTRVMTDGNLTDSNNATFRLLDGASDWNAETVLEITIHNITFASGDHRAKVMVEYGKTATIQFHIT